MPVGPAWTRATQSLQLPRQAGGPWHLKISQFIKIRSKSPNQPLWFRLRLNPSRSGSIGRAAPEQDQPVPVGHQPSPLSPLPFLFYLSFVFGGPAPSRDRLLWDTGPLSVIVSISCGLGRTDTLKEPPALRYRSPRYRYQRRLFWCPQHPNRLPCKARELGLPLRTS